MERGIETALGSAGDFAGAAVWRQACRELAGGLRIAILGVDAEAAGRLAERLRTAAPRVTFPVVALDPEAAEEATLGAQDALLGVQAAVWATPITAALGHTERDAMDRLERLVPVERAVVLTDVHLLQRLADDPEAEGAEVRARLTAIVPAGWSLVDLPEVKGWVDALAARRTAVTRGRRTAVARVLLEDARTRTEAALRESVEAVERAGALLEQEDAVLDEARRHGERVAAHLLGSLRAHTQRLVLDLRTFLQGLDADLGAQVEAVDDLATVRRVLPHWLDHVVEVWMDERLAAWRKGVLDDLAEIRIAEGEARRADLLPPSLHPAPLRAEGGWGRRLAVTAALGGGAALALVGLWVPGALVVGGGLAISLLTREDPSTAHEHLVSSARGAVRRMASDAERLLTEQVDQIEGELASLGDREARSAEEGRAELRAGVIEQRAWHRNRVRELRQVLEALAVRVEAFGAEAP